MDIPRYLLEEKGIPLSDQQRQAVEAEGGEILLLAVPGAGKTTVLTARIAHLMANRRADPRRVLTLTFNKESAREMGERWQRLFGGVFPRDPVFSTIHSFCLGLLRDHAAGRGTQVPELLEGKGAGLKDRLLRELYQQDTGKYLADEDLSNAVNAIGYCVNMRLTGEQATSFDQEVPGFSRLFSRYTGYKRENGLMDFDDMLLFAATALDRNAALRDRARQRYDHILVDEAQDTSRLQHDILAKLVRGELFMVGDEDQSIYGFRGAWPQGLVGFFQRYPGGRLLKLEENYRSTQAIVAGASRLIQRNRQRYQKDIFTSREEGAPIRIIRDLAQEEAYGAIADMLLQVPEEESCAVLYRTSFTGIGLGWTLRRRGIPFFSRETRLGYSGDTITRDVENLVRLAREPGDARIFRQAYFRLGCGIPKDVAEIAVAARPRDLLGYILTELDYPAKSSGRLAWVRRALDRMAKLPPRKQFDIILEDLEYPRALERRCQNGYQLSGYYQKLAVLRDFARSAPDTETFLGSLQGAEQVLDSPRREHIVLSTVHSAKGKEFDRVIIADALEGIFPAADALEDRAMGEPERLEEETRLFYVAMTRAKDRLVIVAPSRCLGRSLAPSRFLYDVGQSVPTVGDVPLVPGLRVMHSFFGLGVVEEVDGVRRQARVAFRHYGKKTFTIDSLSDSKLFQLM